MDGPARIPVGHRASLCLPALAALGLVAGCSLPAEPTGLQRSGPQHSGPQHSGPQQSGPQQSGPQQLGAANVESGSAEAAARPRARDLGIRIGDLEPGLRNGITDVAGVRVAHQTIAGGPGIRTGVTVILPHGGNLFRAKVPAAVVVGNGFGKLTGSVQVQELGELESPIALTNTLSVGRCADALVGWLLEQPGNEGVRSINAVVGETNDGRLNDIRGRHVQAAHVQAALEAAMAMPGGAEVAEGSVGAGHGTVCFGWKGGIGTSSRRVQPGVGVAPCTVGVLVQTNFGGRLTIAGRVAGPGLDPRRSAQPVPNKPVPNKQGANKQGANKQGADRRQADGAQEHGSCMIVVATDAPIGHRNLERLARRALIGMGRTGASFSNGSGDFVIAFSTAESLRIDAGSPTRGGSELSNDRMTGLFVAAADATEEAILNSLLRATPVTSAVGSADAIPVAQVKLLLGER